MYDTHTKQKNLVISEPAQLMKTSHDILLEK